MVWVGVWFLLVIGALAVFVMLARSLWRKTMALAREMSAAARRLSRDGSPAGSSGAGAKPVAVTDDLAVFTEPSLWRASRAARPRERARRGPRSIDLGPRHRAHARG